jgi:hypothetical protein
MYKRIALFVFVTLLTSISAMAQCSEPSMSGTLRICFPTNGSTIIGGTTFELAANTGGASIRGVAVYDNGVRVDSLGFLPARLIEGAIHDGSHRVTIKIWDSEGRVYSDTTSFTKVGGFDPGGCKPATIGVTLCSPKSGGLEPNFSVPVSVAVKTVAPTTAWKLYMDGVLIRKSDASTLKSILTPIGLSAGQHKATVVAWDSKGTVYKTSHSFTTFFMYDCNPDTGACSPGIVADAPDGFGPAMAVDAPQTFEFHAEVTGNKSPIQKMSVTLDGVVIADGQGPGIVKTVTTKPGSHTMMVQAMDTKGKLYATYGTVNVH